MEKKQTGNVWNQSGCARLFRICSPEVKRPRENMEIWKTCGIGKVGIRILIEKEYYRI